MVSSQKTIIWWWKWNIWIYCLCKNTITKLLSWSFYVTPAQKSCIFCYYWIIVIIMYWIKYLLMLSRLLIYLLSLNQTDSNTFHCLLTDLMNVHSVQIKTDRKQQQQKHLFCERRVGRGSPGNNTKVFYSLGWNLATENKQTYSSVSSDRNHESVL